MLAEIVSNTGGYLLLLLGLAFCSAFNFWIIGRFNLFDSRLAKPVLSYLTVIVALLVWGVSIARLADIVQPASFTDVFFLVVALIAGLFIALAVAAVGSVAGLWLGTHMMATGDNTSQEASA